MTPNRDDADWRREHPELAELPSDTAFLAPPATPTPESTLHELAPNAGRGWLSPYSLWTERAPVDLMATWQPRSRSGRMLRTGVALAVLAGLGAGVVAGVLAVLRG